MTRWPLLLALLVALPLAGRALGPRGAGSGQPLRTAEQALRHAAGIDHGGGAVGGAAPDDPAGTFEEQACLAPDEAEQALQRFSQFLQFDTTSSPAAPHHVVKEAEFRRLHAWAPKAYPEVWEAMQVEEVGSGGLSFLLTWPGTAPAPAPSAAAPLPVLFLSHMDVVPVANETLANWTHPPFSGARVDGYVWGRGTLDDKVGVSGLLEAATLLLRQGWAPQRTIYFAFGQDEEVGGEEGAARTAALLAQRGIQVAMVYDEGGSIGADGFPPYTSYPIALVGTAEKGYATIMIHVSAAGGHSSIPPLDGSSAAATAARVITAIDRRPPPAALLEPATHFLAAIAPYTPGIRGRLFAAAGAGLGGRMLRTLVAQVFLAHDSPETASLVRNTAAVTGLSSGFAENVLPPSASVRVNFRLLPGSNVTELLDYLARVSGSDLPRLRFELSSASNASLATPVTPQDSPYFGMLRAALQETYKLAGGAGAVEVVPTLMGGGTDSKHYLPISAGGALRHTPVSMHKADGDLARVHGLNERVSAADFLRSVCTQRRLLQLAGAL